MLKDREAIAARPSQGVFVSYGIGLPLALAALFVCLVALLDGAQALAWEGALPPRALVLNATPGLILALVCIGLTRRPLFSFVVSGVLYLGLYSASRIKTEHLGAPLMPQDLELLSVSSVGLLSNYAGFGLKEVLATLVGAVAAVGLFRLEPLTFRRFGVATTLMALIVAYLLHFWWKGLDPDDPTFERAGIEFEAWTPQLSVEGSGLINAFVMFGRIRGAASGTFDEEAGNSVVFVERLLPVVSDRPSLGGEHPDIIVIQSEALFDPSLIEGMQARTFMPRLKAQGWRSSGPLYVPTYGGGTIRTEFEALTGISLKNLPSVQYPYLELDINIIPSIVEPLVGSGYRTFAVHPNNPDFWRRGSVFRSFGFDVSVWKNGFSVPVTNDGPYASDASLVDEAISLLRSSSTDPFFMFLMTIQNHGPYLWHYSLTEQALAGFEVPPGLSADGARELRTYLYHLAQGEKELVRLADFLKERGRPTLLYVYGDHLPALPNVFRELGIAGAHTETTAPSVWICMEIMARGCPPNNTKMASWKIPGFIKSAANASGDPYFMLKYALPVESATLTRSPQAPVAVAGEWLSELEAAHRSADAARVNGDFSRRLDEAQELLANRTVETSQRVIASPLTFGRYVDERYRVVGISDAFAEGERFFAFLDFSGFIRDLRYEIVMKNSAGVEVYRAAQEVGDLHGAVRKNFDFDGIGLPAGEYLAEVVLDGETLSVAILNIL